MRAVIQRGPVYFTQVTAVDAAGQPLTFEFGAALPAEATKFDTTADAQAFINEHPALAGAVTLEVH